MQTFTKLGRRIELPSEDDDVQSIKQAIEDGTNWSNNELKQFKSYEESNLPEAYKAAVSRGRPKSQNPKVLLSVRYSSEVVEYFKSTGKGWQTRMDEVLQKYVISQR